jgi:hypothetical protein
MLVIEWYVLKLLRCCTHNLVFCCFVNQAINNKIIAIKDLDIYNNVKQANAI